MLKLVRLQFWMDKIAFQSIIPCDANAQIYEQAKLDKQANKNAQFLKGLIEAENEDSILFDTHSAVSLFAALRIMTASVLPAFT